MKFEKVSNAMLLISTLLLFFGGLFMIVFPMAIYKLALIILVVALGLLCLLNLGSALRAAKGERMSRVLSAAAFGAGALLFGLNETLLAYSITRLFGVLMIILGVAAAASCVKLARDKAPGWLRQGIRALISLIIGAILFGDIIESGDVAFMITGCYMILYSFMFLSDFRRERKLARDPNAMIKQRGRIALPPAIAAFIPIKLLSTINDAFAHNLPVPHLSGDDGSSPELEVFIHLKDGAIEGLGHCDIGFGDGVWSYGTYDNHALYLGGLFAKGTLAYTQRAGYIENCLTQEKKVLIGFGIRLDAKARAAVTEQLQKLLENSHRWYSDHDKMVDGELPEAEYNDPASILAKKYGSMFFQFDKGHPFKTYFALGTNCVLLADSIVGASGIDLLRVNGVVTPGTYYQYLDKLFNLGDTAVVSKNIYKKDSVSA